MRVLATYTTIHVDAACVDAPVHVASLNKYLSIYVSIYLSIYYVKPRAHDIAASGSSVLISDRRTHGVF